MKSDRLVLSLKQLQQKIDLSLDERDALWQAERIVAKEIPAKPETELTKVDGIVIYADILCPTCKEVFDDDVIDKRVHRCPACGQMLRWEDD